ncbi:hypothetical protein IGI37_003793 [Enterococcus sp. AZ194]|uniref:trans-sulfuration enzyme family protein n=1 Tax=Enterococcus sp. AZ194 TaxID=2774629 RepID=UPI003F246CAA
MTDTSKNQILLHYKDEYDKFRGATNPPIYQSSLFIQETSSNHIEDEGYVYTRISNPTTAVAEEKLAALENGERALCFSSGMGAISSGIMHFIQKDSHVICIETAYGPVRNFLVNYLKKFGVEITFVTGNNLEEIEHAMTEQTSLVYLESPSSFIYTVQDLSEVAKMCKKRGIATIVDNSYATPIFQNPLDYGIDLVVHSASKFLGGHSDILGGVLIGRAEIVDPMIEGERALFGAVMDPHQAWLLIRGMRTLDLRLMKHQETALTVAKFLEQQKKVARVFYLGLESHPQYELGKKQLSGTSSLISIVLDYPEEIINQFIGKLHYFQHGVSWGGYESLIAKVTVDKTQPGVPDNLLRIHVGLEDADLLINDLKQALEIL